MPNGDVFTPTPGESYVTGPGEQPDNGSPTFKPSDNILMATKCLKSLLLKYLIGSKWDVVRTPLE